MALLNVELRLWIDLKTQELVGIYNNASSVNLRHKPTAYARNLYLNISCKV